MNHTITPYSEFTLTSRCTILLLTLLSVNLAVGAVGHTMMYSAAYTDRNSIALSSLPVVSVLLIGGLLWLIFGRRELRRHFYTMLVAAVYGLALSPFLRLLPVSGAVTSALLTSLLAVAIYVGIQRHDGLRKMVSGKKYFLTLLVAGALLWLLNASLSVYVLRLISLPV